MIKAVQDYAVQYCAIKSLPFTAATMALDCVSAAMSTIFPADADTKIINDLAVSKSKAAKSAANMLRCINHVRAKVDTGGRRSAEVRKRDRSSEDTPSNTKRSRFRLHRTTVSKRVSKLGSEIVQKKHQYLVGCKHVGLIIDEGNNFARSCPVYTACISCDTQFNWRVQFIGQENCEGKKDGEAIWKLAKKTFVDQGFADIWEKIECVGTDGDSTMRSTPKYSGK